MNIKLSKCATLVVDITDDMVRDYKECEELSRIPGGPGKECESCLLNLEYETSLCEMSVVTEEIIRRLKHA